MSLVPAGSFLSAGLGGYLWGGKAMLGDLQQYWGGGGILLLAARGQAGGVDEGRRSHSQNGAGDGSERVG